jgi:CHAT domain-containing protein
VSDRCGWRWRVALPGRAASTLLLAAALVGQEGPTALARLRSLLAEAATRQADADAAGARAAVARAAPIAAGLDLTDDAACAALVALARTALNVGEMDTATSVAERLIAGRKVVDGERDAAVLDAYDLIGLVKEMSGDPGGALQHFEAACAKFASTLPADDPALFRMQLRVGLHMAGLGRVREAVATSESALAGLTARLPDDDVRLNMARALVASVYSTAGDSRASLALYAQALPILEQKLSADNESLESLQVNHGVAVARAGDYARARAIWEGALTARQRRLPPHHPLVLETQTYLLFSYAMQGEARRALEMGTQVLAVRSQTQPPDHPEVLNLCTNLAAMREILGDLRGAEDLLQRVVAAWEVADTPNPQRQAWAMAALAGVRFELGEFDGVRGLLERARELQADLPEHHPEALRVQQVLALALAQEGDTAAALALGAHVVEVCAAHYPDDWQVQHVARANLAQVMFKTGDFAGARDLQQLPPQLVALGAEHPDVIVARGELGASLLALGDLAGARRELAAAVRGYAAMIEIASAVFSPIATEKHNAHLAVPVSELLSAGADTTDPRQHAEDLECVIAVRGHSERRAHFAAAVRAAAARDQQVHARLQAALAARASLLQLLESADAADADALRAAERAAARADEDLTLALGEGRASARLPLAELGPRLPADKAAVLTVTYGRVAPVAPGRKIDVVEHVACFVVTRGGVRRHELGEGKPIAAAVNSLRYHLRHGGEAEVKVQARNLPTALRDVLRSLPAGLRHLLVCPDGALATVPWELLPGSDGEPLGERVEVTYADNLTAPEPAGLPLHPPSLLAVGGVDFDAVVPATASPLGPVPSLALRGDAAYPPLPGARAEVNGVVAAFVAAHPDAACKLLVGAQASRAGVIDAAPHCRYLHLATHGSAAADRFWQPMPAKGAATPALDRGLLARLVLAGANRPRANDMATSMLTASELAELDLTRCELAVLSACDANVGERWFGEAVTGINRGLKLAGVRHTITSLWKVRDDGAQAFFAAFYARLWQRDGEPCSIAAALAHARAATKSRGFGPDVWACFVHYGPLAD